ncbi:hypothetical protein ACKGJI_04565 [Sulfurospirillum sp. 1307]
MKLQGLKRIMFTGYDKSNKSYKYSAFTEDTIYKFKVFDLSEYGYSIFSKDNKFNIIHDCDLFSDSTMLLAENVEAKEPHIAICEFLEFDYDKFQNDIYALVDKDFFMDYLKFGIDDCYISIPIDNVCTPNTNWSSSDTILALIDKEYKNICDDNDDEDFVKDIFSHVLDLSDNYTYLNEFLISVKEYLFYKYMSDEDKKKLHDRKLDYSLRPSCSNFERNFKDNVYEYNFKTSFDDTDDDVVYTEKIELTIKYNPKNKF